ncbi:hypothetical protein [Sediminibacter sp. Hel_I_10]|uniref:hypothetical protein n=1 Tax=Sediminibacter sp. Hel_I_10 TaxID=1392490 RepID=UPI00056B398B|nr:hypothetical protein [Sediminibacter sp. Hel_I_10]
MKALQIIIILHFVLISSCQTGKLDNITDLPFGMKEASALEYTANDRLLWVIEDAGNPNTLFALDGKGQLSKTLEVEGAINTDWEDLASDSEGNVYIGDFGNNGKDREDFQIYKVERPGKEDKTCKAETIAFKLPEDMESMDFEAFFLFKNRFYIFSKDDKHGVMISVENNIGNQVAKEVIKFNLDGKHDKVTSADISANGKTVVLLNHEKVWKLTNFKSDAFFEGTVEVIGFDHDSQKEGIVFIRENEVLITDEQKGHEGGNLYRFEL